VYSFIKFLKLEADAVDQEEERHFISTEIVELILKLFLRRRRRKKSPLLFGGSSSVIT